MTTEFTSADEATRRDGSALSEGLGPLPEPRLWYDPETQRCSSMVPLRPTYEPVWDEDDMRALVKERDGLMQTLRDEMDENLRLRALGGAMPDENITAMTERLIRELEAHRLYARALCKAVDAATAFAGTVAGGASWWDDVWAEHAAALDRAREQITLAGGPNVL